MSSRTFSSKPCAFEWWASKMTFCKVTSEETVNGLCPLYIAIWIRKVMIKHWVLGWFGSSLFSPKHPADYPALYQLFFWESTLVRLLTFIFLRIFNVCNGVIGVSPSPQWGLGDFMMLGQVVIFLLLICPRQKSFMTTTGRQTLFPYMLHHPLMPSAILEVELMEVFQKWIWCKGCWGSRGPFVLFFFPT